MWVYYVTELVENLREMRRPDGITDTIGQVLLDWVPKLECYVPYCSNQVYAKHLLDLKKQDPNVDDFLQRCQDSPFSRRLDLWSFLDVPRSRLVKYPLLFKNILKLVSSYYLCKMYPISSCLTHWINWPQ